MIIIQINLSDEIKFDALESASGMHKEDVKIIVGYCSGI